ncbi:ABC transporter permease [Candidatus Korarchaeum cryptofilum]|jgi:peptide/nickel transport system permease protein|uniref:ABC-type dipeptide/oligopeptide/nickel transport system, permease component n=1 Tax=Korarchaeum cryptofilum (strain OPF8) TaxID=374847 RepID=B1L5E7_KORCO|nr:ABC transporter permease [Candidatus Korarchaeum cryptofilum]ACB07676.1 ABC-type dipeptide/oligopeptide/nickel transport system, permease component [Candidatus Korarchaeum cryptofilum OPF8]
MDLRTYIIRRLALMIFVLFGIIVITFVVSHVIPADPIGAILGPQASPELVEKIRREWGFDKPLHEQFFDYIYKVVRGDLGRSIKTNKPVMEDLLYFFPATIELATAAIIVAIAIGIPLGIISAVKKDKWPDHISRIFALMGVSMPVFWLGLILLFVLYYKLGIFPGPGRLDPGIPEPPRITGLLTIDSLITGNFEAFINALWHLALPSFVLGYYASASIARITRTALLEVLTQDFIKAARSKGLAERIVLFRHALRNALIPTTTVIGMAYGSLLEGAILTETIFAWPGLGRYSTGAFLSVDFMAVMGSTLLIAIVYSLANLIVDILYAFLDPRIRYA